MQRKRSVVAETVECSSSRHRPDEMSVFSLVEERAGFLSGPGGSQEFDAVLMHLDLARDVTVQNSRLPRQSFFRAQRHIVARQDARRLWQRAQRRQYFLSEPLEPGTHELHNEPLVVAVADERRTSIGLAVHQADRVGVIFERYPSRDCGCDSLVPPRLVDNRVGIAIEQPQRDLRERTPESPPDWLAATVVNENRAGVHHWPLRHVRAIDPGMPAHPTPCTFGIHARNSHSSM